MQNITIMKKIIFSFTLLVFVVKSFGQTTSPAFSKDYYLKKSKNQKTVGWIMLGGGVAMTTIGIIIPNTQTNDPNDPFGVDPFSGNEGAAIVAAAGLVSALGSIPFFISSAKNARKAAMISFNNQKVLFPQQNTFVLKTRPSLTLKLEL